VPRDPQADILQELQAAMRQSLPPYMHPRSITLLPALPLNENGKVNRAQLPDPVAAGATGTEAGIKPRTDTEKRLAKLWQEVLDHPEPRVNDDFFALGGHSLRATQLASRIRREFGVAIPLRTVFEKPTIAEQTVFLDAHNPSASIAPPSIAIAARTRRVQ